MRPTELGEAQYDLDHTQALRHNNLALALSRLMGDKTTANSERWIDPDRIDGGDPDNLSRWAAVSCHGGRFDRNGWTSTSDYRDQAEGELHDCISNEYPGQPMMLVDLDSGECWEPIIDLRFKPLWREPCAKTA